MPDWSGPHAGEDYLNALAHRPAADAADLPWISYSTAETLTRATVFCLSVVALYVFARHALPWLDQFVWRPGASKAARAWTRAKGWWLAG